MTFSSQFGVNLGEFLVTCIALIVLGLIYNHMVDWLHKRGLNDGYTWLEVVAGTAVTVALAGFTIGWSNVFVLFCYFACSGLFMALGDIWRHVKARQRELRRERLNDIAESINELPFD